MELVVKRTPTSDRPSVGLIPISGEAKGEGAKDGIPGPAPVMLGASQTKTTPRFPVFVVIQTGAPFFETTWVCLFVGDTKNAGVPFGLS